MRYLATTAVYRVTNYQWVYTPQYYEIETKARRDETMKYVCQNDKHRISEGA
jgi:hypothetical protein